MSGDLVRAPVLLVSAEAMDSEKGRAVTTLRIDGDEPVFAGHFPGFALFPGVCLIECVNRTVMAASGRRRLMLREVEAARFLEPVFPGDEIEIALESQRTSRSWRCSARVRTSRGDAATIRVRYEP